MQRRMQRCRNHQLRCTFGFAESFERIIDSFVDSTISFVVQAGKAAHKSALGGSIIEGIGLAVNSYPACCMCCLVEAGGCLMCIVVMLGSISAFTGNLVLCCCKKDKVAHPRARNPIYSTQCTVSPSISRSRSRSRPRPHPHPHPHPHAHARHHFSAVCKS